MGVLTFLTSTSFTLRKMHTLRMLSYDHQGVGGCINVPDEHFLYVTEDANVAHAVSCVKDYSHKRFKLAQVNHKQNIFTKTKTYHFRGRLWDKSYRAIVASTQGWNMETLEKMATSVDAPKKKQNVYKKRYTWAYNWTWRHNAALLQTVASALPQALWHR